MSKSNSSIIIAGLALFSMFFGAGDLLWPLLLGGSAGDKSFYALIGLLVTGVSLPLLGVIAMVLFKGDTQAFFGRIGKVPCFLLLFIIQAILGPLGSLPRILTLTYASLTSYLPSFVNFAYFSIGFACLIFLMSLKKSRIVQILGSLLTPALLLCLLGLFILGFIHPPASVPLMEKGEALKSGLNVGYNTLDLLASFLFAPLVLSHFQGEGVEVKSLFRKMVQASLIAASILGIMYVGLTFLGSYYTPVLPEHLPEARLSAISHHLFGEKGALLASIIVVLACMTTAIPLSAISAEYIQKTLSKGKITFLKGLALSLAISVLISLLGFMGIAQLLSPLLQIVCPGLIVLSVLNILHRLYEIKIAKVPVYAAFALSTIGYALFV